MKIRVDPRTGIIVAGNTRKPRPPDRPPRRGRAPVQPVDLGALQAIGQAIGQTIVDALRNWQPTVLNSPGLPSDQVRTFTRTPNQADQSIDIDESVIDVGLEKTEALKKGEGSGTLAKTEVNSDTSLSQSKDRLAALKRRGAKKNAKN